MPDDWSREEVEACVADYLDMLLMELRGGEFNKAERNRRLQQLLPQRSRGSIEWKHQNVSAVLVQMGLPYVRGYKPRSNYQELLRVVLEERLSAANPLFEAAESVVERNILAPPSVTDILSVLVPPPGRDDEPRGLREMPRIGRRSVRRNYLEAEARNRSLGLAGEQFVLRYEHERLWRANERTLAERIEHVANTQGDHLGFDIASFEVDGRERLIEVKTTQFGALTPFFASRNEVDVSESRYENYHLYRLFDFVREPKMFALAGSLGRTCELNAVQFSALPKSSG
jgi:uncharacterized protein DUF3883